ncbi:hypothetical protein CEP54_004426 [Fusarium duplospermum]|uniref:Uncharacterized protein n=1 Tax=Fusarium duplospermum TaxID=1325734 RepID=A0A428QI27_9HYPO|nr:hypothetical protein CEP54_004426 [Fusarium duplospermum]
MFAITKLLPTTRREPRAENNQQDEGRAGLIAAGRMLFSLLYDGNDDWSRQFGSNDRILPKDENQPYLALLGDGVENEVESFMFGPHMESHTRGLQAKRVHSLIFESPTKRPNRLLEAPDGASSPLVPRRIYINNPGGDEILELIRRVPASQAEGFRELLAKYVDDNPRPYFGLRECTGWKAFSFIFNIPYYAITTEDAKDHRKVWNAGRSTEMRSRESLDFLYPSYYRKEDRRVRNVGSQDEPRFIHEVVCSALITGQSDTYWTCFFFNEDLCQEPQEQRLQAEAELDEDGGTTDPITMTEETAASFQPPRVYGLQALVSQLETILEHQWAIERCFKESLKVLKAGLVSNSDQDIDLKQVRKWGNSFNSVLAEVTSSNSRLLERFNRFLFEEDVRFGVDGNPDGRLFQSLKRDPIAIPALRKLVDLSRELKSVNRDLEWLMRAYDDFRRERKDDQLEEGNSRFDQGQKLQQLLRAIAALQVLVATGSKCRNLFVLKPNLTLTL